MKEYLLFTGENYYPEGGAHDLYSSHDTLEEALEAGREFLKDSTDLSGEWAHVYNVGGMITDIEDIPSDA